MQRNLTYPDRILRLILGTMLLAWAIAGGPTWAYLGLIFLATGAWAKCPFYWTLGINKKN